MTDLETRLRSQLHEAAAHRPGSTRLAELVDAHIDRRARRARIQRPAMIATTVVIVLVIGALAVQGRNDKAGLATGTPRDGLPGWRAIADLPIEPRVQHAAVAMGEQVLVFGGYVGDDLATGAAIYDPVTGRWREAAAPPGAMGMPVTVWTGSAVLALDGDGDLASYDPGTDRWSSLAPSPFENAASTVTSAVWTGTGMLVVPGDRSREDSPPPPVGPALYDPTADAWTQFDPAPIPYSYGFTDAVWTGAESVMVGTTGHTGSSFAQLRIVAFSPANGWRELPPPPLEHIDSREIGWGGWTGTELVVGGGATWSDEALAVASELATTGRDATAEDQAMLAPTLGTDAAAWNPTTDTWRRLPDSPVPTDGLRRFSDAWTGHEMVTWELAMDQEGNPQFTGRLVLLDPATGAWRISPGVPGSARVGAPATWTGRELVVVSGRVLSKEHPVTCCSPLPTGLAFTP